MATSWTTLPHGFMGDLCPDNAESHETSELLCGIGAIARGEAYLAWARYRAVIELYQRLVLGREGTDGFIQDGFTDCAARIAKTLAQPRYKAEKTLNTAIGLRELPDVLECLRDGLISDEHAQLVVQRTDLLGEAARNRGVHPTQPPADAVDKSDESDASPAGAIPDAAAPDEPTSHEPISHEPTPHGPTPPPNAEELAPKVSAEIAEVLRNKKGSWSRTRLRDMVDRIVFRHDPDSVRERRRHALDERGVWFHDRQDGTGEMDVVMSAENTRIAKQALEALADTVCPADGRTRQQRKSDAHFALVTQTRFECQCGREDCTAEIPDLTEAPARTSIVIHVVADEGTINGTTVNVGYVDGHGVISDEHVRDLAARPDAAIKPLVPTGTPMNPDGTYTLPAHLPSDPYRPSSALDTFIRVRDGICTDPGCERSAWHADLDHVTEYNHADPASGGQTTPENMNAKCRLDHLLKTYGDWVDDQYRDDNGQLRTEYTTPDGTTIAGEAETFEDFFPGLRRIRFAAPWQDMPDSHTRSRPPQVDNPTRARTRVANKHARRSAERHRNRQRRQPDPDNPPPF